MSVLSKIFKRKPGGTIIGNLLRNQVKTLSGGILGNGAMLLQDSKELETGEINNSQIEKSKQILDTEINTGDDKKLTWSLEAGNPKQTEINPQTWYIIGGLAVAYFLFTRK
jgi:hypothetical protein